MLKKINKKIAFYLLLFLLICVRETLIYACKLFSFFFKGIIFYLAGSKKSRHFTRHNTGVRIAMFSFLWYKFKLL